MSGTNAAGPGPCPRQLDAILRVGEIDKHLTSGGRMTFWELVERVLAVVLEQGKDGKFARNVLGALRENSGRSTTT